MHVNYNCMMTLQFCNGMCIADGDHFYSKVKLKYRLYFMFKLLTVKIHTTYVIWNTSALPQILYFN